MDLEPWAVFSVSQVAAAAHFTSWIQEPAPCLTPVSTTLPDKGMLYRSLSPQLATFWTWDVSALWLGTGVGYSAAEASLDLALTLFLPFLTVH